jgi:hypothetical protein
MAQRRSIYCGQGINEEILIIGYRFESRNWHPVFKDQDQKRNVSINFIHHFENNSESVPGTWKASTQG